MAKLAVINREAKRRATVKKFAEKRKALLAMLQDPKATDDAKDQARGKLQALARHASPARPRNPCALTGRPRGTCRKCGLGRSTVRAPAARGEITGAIEASW